MWTGERRITLSDAAELWTEASGTGPPVVFCHGGPGLWDYLAPLAALVDDRVTAIRFDQRGCGRSTGARGPFTIARAVADLDELRAALGIERWAVLGHSWGAELAVRYAAAHPDRVSGVVYVAGIGAGDGFRDAFVAEVERRRSAEDTARLQELGTRDRCEDEEREYCVLRWRTDFSPASDTRAHAEALWRARPPDAAVNLRANHELWADRLTDDLLGVARTVRAPVTMICGANDPRPWSATDELLAALPDAERTVLAGAGHAPWAERPDETRDLILDATGRMT